MFMWEVTLFAKKIWMNSPYQMSWLTIADTGEGAREQILDSHDLTGVNVERILAKKVNEPILIDIKE